MPRIESAVDVSGQLTSNSNKVERNYDHHNTTYTDIFGRNIEQSQYCRIAEAITFLFAQQIRADDAPRTHSSFVVQTNHNLPSIPMTL
jgi:hypothetical protein